MTLSTVSSSMRVSMRVTVVVLALSSPALSQTTGTEKPHERRSFMEGAGFLGLAGTGGGVEAGVPLWHRPSPGGRRGTTLGLRLRFDAETQNHPWDDVSTDPARFYSLFVAAQFPPMSMETSIGYTVATDRAGDSVSGPTVALGFPTDPTDRLTIVWRIALSLRHSWLQAGIGVRWRF